MTSIICPAYFWTLFISIKHSQLPVSDTVSTARQTSRIPHMNKTIKELPEHSRPREKLRERGPAALTDDELVAAIIGMGTAGVDVRTMARNVVALLRKERGALTLEPLMSIPGMGLAKGG